MGVTLVRYELNDQIDWGLLRNEMIFSLEGTYPDLDAVLEHGMVDIHTIRKQHADQGIPVSHASLLCPVTAPARILCQSHNFLSEDKQQKPAPPFYVRKDESALTHHRAEILRPAGVHLLEANVTLGLVIGKSIFRPTAISEETLKEYVAGWVICSDIMARDQILKESGQQHFQSKSYRGFCPTGPGIYLPDAEDWEKFNDLRLTLSVNGETREEYSTRQWHKRPFESLSELSGIIDLKAGDLLLTGTGPMSEVTPPSGMMKKLGGLLFSEEKRLTAFLETLAKESHYLKNGDTIRTRIVSADGTIDLGEQHYSIATS